MIEELQARYNRKMRLRKKPKKKGITISISPDAKKQKMLEKIADDFRKEGHRDNVIKNWRRKNGKN